VLVAAVVSSCHGGGSGGALPPIGSRHLQATALSPNVAQWNSGTPWAPASIAVSMRAAPAVGDVLIVTLWNNGQSSGAANTYTPPAGWKLVDQNTSRAYATYQAFTHVVSAGDANSYVFTPLAAQRQHAWIAADVSGAAAVDTSGNAFIANATAYTTPSLTPSQATDLALAFNMPMTTSAPSWTNPSTWMLGIGPLSTWRAEALLQSLSSTAPVSESSTLSASASGFSALILLSPSQAQSTPTPSPSASSSATPAPTPTAGGGAAPSPSQWTSGAMFAPASLAVSWPSMPSAGDVLVVALWNNGQSTGAANTYTPPAGWNVTDSNASAYATYQVFWHVVASGETNRYVFTPQAAQREQAWIGADVGGASGVEKSSDRYIGNSTAYTTPTIAPAQSGDLALAFDLPMTASSVTWTNPANWTLGTGPTSTWRGQALYQALSSSASIAQSATLSSAASGFSGIVLLSPASAQSTPTPVPTVTPASVDWWTFGYDLQRTGYNPDEKIIGTRSFGTIHPLWTTLPNVGNYLQGEPVVATNVNVGGASKTVIYAGAMSGKFYAFDADTGAMVWSKQLGTGSYVCPASGAPGNWGVEGTAVLDRPRSRIYVPDGANQVHALDLATGAEASGWPVSAAPVTSHDFIHTALNYNPNNGLLYTTTGSTCDISPWQGRVAVISTSSASLANTFYPEQGASGGGVWGFGGVSIDPSTNNVFIAVGNADSSNESAAYGEHVVELSPDLNTVIASNFPPNMPFMFDSDFGATPLLFQPVGCPPLLAAVNKSGAFILYDRTNISAGPIQEITMASTGSEFRGVPSYDPVTNYVYVALPDSQGIYLPGIGAFSMTANCTLNPTPVWNGTFGATKDKRSPITIANGVAYIAGYNENTVYAFDAASGAQLWSGSLSGAGQIGPVVVNGRIYVGDVGGTIHAWVP
jgi:outer membrane protein assembly factor BamB